MRVEVQIDPSCEETRVVIVVGRMTEEVAALAQRLTQSGPRVLAGFDGERVAVLAEGDIARVYTEGGKVLAEARGRVYRLRMRLYEAESWLDSARFVRISKAEIINLRQVTGFDLSPSGMICVKLEGGTVTYVSRRYVAKIKQVLGL